MMTRNLRFLLSGVGLIGQQHACLVQARQDCELAALVGPPTEHNQTFASNIGVKLYGTVAEATSAEKIDAAIISSPNEYHFEQAMTCLEQAIPIFVEKPITNTLESAQKLASESARRQIPVLVGHHRTYSPLLEAAAAFIKSSKFGQLVAMQGSALFYKPAHYFIEGPWRTKIGGGPILINLIHEIGIMRHLCGEIKSLTAIAGNRIRNFEVEDTVAISLGFQNGALGTFLLSDTAASNKSWEMTSGENPSYPFYPEHNCYHFAGTNGSLDFPTLKVNYYDNSTTPSWWSTFTHERLNITRSNPLEHQLEHFIKVIHGQELPKVSAYDGYRNMQVVDAIARAITSRTVVELDAEDIAE